MILAPQSIDMIGSEFLRRSWTGVSAAATENAAPQARTEWEDSPNKQIGVREGKVLAEHVRTLRKMPVDVGKTRFKAFSIHGLTLFRGPRPDRRPEF